MSERMTTITLPGIPAGGIADHGEVPVAAMIAQYREHARAQLAEAEAVLAADDEDFRVYSCNGIHVQRRTTILQEGRTR